MDLLDEKSLRRPGFDPGRAVKLEDGQLWSIPCPLIEWAPDFDLAGEVQLASMTTFGPEFDQLIADVENAELKGDEARALFRLARNLLDRNYDLRPEHYRTLLRYQTDSQLGVVSSLGEIYGIARGIAPKPTPAGSDSPS